MKRNIIKLILPATLILSMAAPVYANTSLDTPDRNQEPAAINQDITEEDVLDNTYQDDSDMEIIDAANKYLAERHTVKDIKTTNGVYAILTRSETDRPSIYYTVTETTPIYSLVANDFIHPRDINIDMDIIAVYDVNTPNALSEPAVIAPQAIIVTNREQDIAEYKIDYFGSDGLSRDGTLKLNITENTPIYHSEDSDIADRNVLNNYLLVFYRTTTRSTPPQTNPQAVVNLTDYNQNIQPNENGGTVTTPAQPEEVEEVINPNEELSLAELLKDLEEAHKYEQGYENAYAIRPVAEKLDYNIHWDEETETITLSKEGTTIILRIGVIQYNRDNAVYTLERAPFIRNNHTFVEIDFIESLMK